MSNKILLIGNYQQTSASREELVNSGVPAGDIILLEEDDNLTVGKVRSKILTHRVKHAIYVEPQRTGTPPFHAFQFRNDREVRDLQTKLHVQGMPKNCIGAKSGGMNYLNKINCVTEVINS